MRRTSLKFLNHDTLPRGLVSHFEALHEEDNTPALNLQPNWADVILDPAILELFYPLYWKVRTMPQLAHHARNCLVQLASLNHSIFSNDEQRISYLTNYVQGFLNLVCNIDVIDHEALGIANIVRQLMGYFRPSGIAALPENLFRSFLEQVTRLTCLFLENAVQEEPVNVIFLFSLVLYGIIGKPLLEPR